MSLDGLLKGIKTAVFSAIALLTIGHAAQNYQPDTIPREQKLFSTVKKKIKSNYGTEIIIDNVNPHPIVKGKLFSDSTGKPDYDKLNDLALELYIEMSKYPKEFFKEVGLDTIFYLNNIMRSRDSASGVQFDRNMVLGSFNPFHHEFFHRVDRSDGGIDNDDKEWIEKTGYKSNSDWKDVIKPYDSGSTSNYSLSGPSEDQAETAVELFKNPIRVHSTIESMNISKRYRERLEGVLKNEPKSDTTYDSSLTQEDFDNLSWIGSKDYIPNKQKEKGYSPRVFDRLRIQIKGLEGSNTVENKVKLIIGTFERLSGGKMDDQYWKLLGEGKNVVGIYNEEDIKELLSDEDRLGVVETYSKNEYYDKALKTLEMISDKDSKIYFSAKADILDKNSSGKEELIKLYTEGIEKNPTNFNLHYNLVSNYYEMGEYDKAMDLINKMKQNEELVNDPQDMESLKSQEAHVLGEMGNYKAALSIYKTKLEQGKDVDEIHMMYILKKSGDIKGAEKIKEEFLKGME